MKNKPQIPPKSFWDDDRWAHENYQTLLKNYPNKWVAVLNKKVICAHQDLRTVKSFLARKPTTGITPLFHIEDASHVYKEKDKDILEAYEQGAFESVSNVKKEIARYREYAKFAISG